MQVILLAAGQSTRLSPVEDKSLLEFGGKTLIEHQIAALKKAKLRDIVVVGNKFNLKKLESVLIVLPELCAEQVPVAVFLEQ